MVMAELMVLICQFHFVGKIHKRENSAFNKIYAQRKILRQEMDKGTLYKR